MPDRPKWEPASPVPRDWMVRFHLFCRLFDKITGVPGDVVECGVGRGTTFCMLAYHAKVQGRKLYGYDSFQGFPEPSPEDASWRQPKKGDWKASMEHVLDVIHESGPWGGGIYFTRGFFAYVLPTCPVESIAFLHLDCDLYQSYKDCLTHLWPRVVPGGIVLFDEYLEFSTSHPNEEKWPGATKAINEFRDSHGGMVFTCDGPSGKYYTVKP